MRPAEPSVADGAAAPLAGSSGGGADGSSGGEAAAVSAEPPVGPRRRASSGTTPGTTPRASTSFPREARLLDGKAYDGVFGDNRRLADRYWTVLVHLPPGAGPDVPARLGLAVAKKRARRAVDRNRIKRVARESFRHARHALGSRQVVIMNRDAASGADAGQLRRALDTLWTRLLRQSPGAPREDRGGRRAGERASRRR